MKKIWKPVEGFEGSYEISSNGQVRSLDRPIVNNGYTYIKQGKMMTMQIVKGYHMVKLCKNGKHSKLYVHRLVLIAFGKPVCGKDIVNHKDGNKLNNQIDNLEWCTIAENNQHAINTGLRSDNLDLFVAHRESRKRIIYAELEDGTRFNAKGP